MAQYSQLKRRGPDPAMASRTTPQPSVTPAVPNSSALDMLEHAQEQIPQAEAEADRLSASITSGGPDAVKAALGQRLGANFSGVRFHTGPDAEARADAAGARAYTSGADVYFGEGGFDPAVAAHELVHTAQQGAVAASVPVLSTPAGGVQRLTWGWPFSKKAREKRAAKKQAKAAAKAAAKAPAPAPAPIQEPSVIIPPSYAATENPGEDALHRSSIHGVMKEGYSAENMSEVIQYIQPELFQSVAQKSAELEDPMAASRFEVFRKENSTGAQLHKAMLKKASAGMNQRLNPFFTQGYRQTDQEIAAQTGAPVPSFASSKASHMGQAVTDMDQLLQAIQEDENAMDAVSQTADLFASFGRYDPERNPAGMVGGREEALHRAMSQMILRSVNPSILQGKTRDSSPYYQQIMNRTAALMHTSNSAITQSMSGDDGKFSDEEKLIRAKLADFYRRNGLMQ